MLESTLHQAQCYSCGSTVTKMPMQHKGKGNKRGSNKGRKCRPHQIHAAVETEPGHAVEGDEGNTGGEGDTHGTREMEDEERDPPWYEEDEGEDFVGRQASGIYFGSGWSSDGSR